MSRRTFSSPRKRTYKTKWCDHCSNFVPKTTFYRHQGDHAEEKTDACYSAPKKAKPLDHEDDFQFDADDSAAGPSNTEQPSNVDYEVPMPVTSGSLHSIAEESRSILTTYATAAQSDLVKAYRTADGKLMNCLLQLDEEQTEERHKRKEVVHYVLLLAKKLDHMFLEQADDRMRQIETELDECADQSAQVQLQREKNDLHALLTKVQSPRLGQAAEEDTNQNMEIADEHSDQDGDEWDMPPGNSDTEETEESQEDMEVWNDDTAAHDVTREPLQEEEDNAGKRDSVVPMPLISLFLLIFSKWKSYFTVSDRAFEALLKIIRTFVFAISTALCIESLKTIALSLPNTLYMIRKRLGFDRDNFVRYVVCPVCDSVYSEEEAIVTVRDGRSERKKSAKCSFVEYPNHKYAKFRKACGATLMKTVLGKKGREFLYPKRTFCYRSITQSLEDLLQRPGFIESCERWRQRDRPGGSYTDVYDGQVWQDFQVVNGEPFLAEEGNLAFMLNVDWFQPYKNINDSTGVMYLAIMNLPREERFKEENIIVLGIIPGPREPKRHINGFLKPFVAELQSLWEGVPLKDSSTVGKNYYRAALLCLASDIPAARKTGGFYGHMANKGCSKCLKSFPRNQSNRVDYSGFQEEWPQRSHEQHCKYAADAQRANTRAQRENIEKIYGARYSCIQDLGYFNVVRLHIVDAMHNLLEGTAKRVMQVWKDTEVLSKEDFCTLQSRVDSVIVPSNLESGVPTKIASSFEGFTAAQWKSWVCVHSLFALKGLIPQEDYNIWRVFVSATRLLCARVITEEQLEDANRYLKIFCNTFERKYGKEWCTMNMHLHLHLATCIRDFGPVHSFWCFSFERANGSLGDYHANNHDTEINMMRKWLLDWKVAHAYKQKADRLQETDLIDIHSIFNQPVLSKTIKSATKLDLLTKLSHDNNLDLYKNFELNDEYEAMLPPVKTSSMSLEENKSLLAMFQILYPKEIINRVSFHYHYCDRYDLAGYLLSTSDYRKGSSSCVYAKWFSHKEITGEPIIDPSASFRPGAISNIWKVFVFLKTENTIRKVVHTVAEVRWFLEHGDRYFYGITSPCTVWDTSYEPWSHASFIPIKRISNQCAFCEYEVPFSATRAETVNVVIPLTSVRCV